MTEQLAPSAPKAAAVETPRHPPTAVGIGEILWDLLPDGLRLGGAPFNVIAHLARFGYGAMMISALGDDVLGAEARRAAVELGVDTHFIATVGVPTGTARVDLDAAGTPRFRLVPPAAWQSARLGSTELAQLVAGKPEALVVGTLAQRFPGVRSTTERIARAIPDALIVYDVNLRPGRWSGALVAELLGLASVAKLNDDELRRLAVVLDAPTDTRAFAGEIARRFGLAAVCVTRGKRGACLWIDSEYLEAGGVETNVVDTIGAGDAFTAVLIDGLLKAQPPASILQQANDYAALVASRPGAIPELRRYPGSGGRPGRRQSAIEITRIRATERAVDARADRDQPGFDYVAND
jgi:fructokinase